VELCAMPTFQKSTYLESPKLIKKFLSININASWPQIKCYRIGLGTPIGNFGEPSRLAFHNLIGGPSIRLQTTSTGETMYCIIGQPNKSTKI